MSNFTEIRPVGTALIPTDGWTDMTKLIGASTDLANAPRKGGCTRRCMFTGIQLIIILRPLCNFETVHPF